MRTCSKICCLKKSRRRYNVLQTHSRKRNRSADQPFPNSKPIHFLQNQRT
nr:MAG TPA: hypothetical protein [Caudoviricetes sp.]